MTNEEIDTKLASIVDAIAQQLGVAVSYRYLPGSSYFKLQTRPCGEDEDAVTLAAQILAEVEASRPNQKILAIGGRSVIDPETFEAILVLYVYVEKTEAELIELFFAQFDVKLCSLDDFMQHLKITSHATGYTTLKTILTTNSTATSS